MSLSLNSTRTSPDVDYCQRAIGQLERLARNAYARNERKRAYLRQLERIRNLVASAIALVLPVVIGVFAFNYGRRLGYFGGGNRMLGGSIVWLFGMFISSAMLFILTYLAIQALWKSRALAGLRNRVEAPVLARYDDVRKARNQAAEQILGCDELSGQRIPARYLSIEALTLLMRYFRSGQASDVETAVWMLESDFRDQTHGANIIPDDTLVARERRYLAEYWRDPSRLVMGA